MTGIMFRNMVKSGAAFLELHRDEINDLNVFPIPDGDTGSNMSLTMQGGAEAECISDSISDTSEKIADSMLLSARGNSGVILSQMFAGLAEGLYGLETAGIEDIEKAVHKAVKRAYSAVVTPTEGTMLTVARETKEAVEHSRFDSIEEFLDCCISEAKKALERTPEKLDVLKQAGVVDSGGAGLVYILEGMSSSLNGKRYETLNTSAKPDVKINTDLFTEDSVLEFGYCTEVLVRLQKCKCNIDEFDINGLISYMNGIGDSIVAFRNGSIVKLHVHTMTPEKVLGYCRQYGEFLTVKIENMMMQHNEIIGHEKEKNAQRKRCAVVAVANGDGIRDQFIKFGADVIINGGQSMNPSAGELISAFDEANADTVFVLPNNGNIILSAKQAAGLYKRSDVRVIPTHNIGDCYAVLSMLDLEAENPDDIERDMNEAMKGTVTAEISRSTRDTEIDGISVRKGEYIGIIGKRIVSSDTDCFDTAVAAAALTDPDKHSSLILLEGRNADKNTTADICAYLREKYHGLEIYASRGGQEIYDYIMVVS